MDVQVPPQIPRPATQEKVGKRNRTTTEGGGTSTHAPFKLHISLVEPVSVRSMFKGNVQTTVLATLPDGSQCERIFEHNLHDCELGRGSFGRVYRATLHHNSRPVAIKTVHLDRRYANRELEFLLTLDHPNIIKVHFYYFTAEHDGHVALQGNAYLHLALECFPETIHSYTHRYRKRGFYVPIFAVKLISYQLFRGLAFLHNQLIAHRDIKPNNILFDEQTGVTKICDLGSMKKLDNSTASVAYICSRHYRAPELLCGSTKYNCNIDVWSAGCTMAELILQRQLFPGSDTADQLSKIIKVLGSPSTKKNARFCDEIDVPLCRAELYKSETPATNFSTIFPIHVPYDAIELLMDLLRLIPSQRSTMAESLASSFFDELREKDCLLRQGVPLPPLFDFTPTECGYLPKIIAGKACSLENPGSEPEFQPQRKRVYSVSRQRSKTPPPQSLSSKDQVGESKGGKQGEAAKLRRQSSSD